MKKKRKEKWTKRKLKKKWFPPLHHTPRHPQSWGGVWTSTLTAIKSFGPYCCTIYVRNDDLAREGSGERLAGPQTIPLASPLHRLTTYGIIENLVSKNLVYSAHCLFGAYCDGNFLEPWSRGKVVDEIQVVSQARMGQVSTWMGDQVLVPSQHTFYVRKGVRLGNSVKWSPHRLYPSIFTYLIRIIRQVDICTSI